MGWNLPGRRLVFLFQECYISDQRSTTTYLYSLRARSQIQVKSQALPGRVKLLVITRYDHVVAAEEREQIVLLQSKSHRLDLGPEDD